MTDFEAQLAELQRGTQEVLVTEELVRKLRRGKPLRIKEGFALTRYDRNTFYTFDSVGYNNYPFVSELVSG